MPRNALDELAFAADLDGIQPLIIDIEAQHHPPKGTGPEVLDGDVGLIHNGGAASLNKEKHSGA